MAIKNQNKHFTEWLQDKLGEAEERSDRKRKYQLLQEQKEAYQRRKSLLQEKRENKKFTGWIQDKFEREQERGERGDLRESRKEFRAWERRYLAGKNKEKREEERIKRDAEREEKKRNRTYESILRKTYHRKRHFEELEGDIDFDRETGKITPKQAEYLKTRVKQQKRHIFLEKEKKYVFGGGRKSLTREATGAMGDLARPYRGKAIPVSNDRSLESVAIKPKMRFANTLVRPNVTYRTPKFNSPYSGITMMPERSSIPSKDNLKARGSLEISGIDFALPVGARKKKRGFEDSER